MPSVLRKGGQWLSHKRHWPKALVENVMCPLCEAPVTAVVFLPEVLDGLICRQCLAMPSDPQRVYPQMYGEIALRLD